MQRDGVVQGGQLHILEWCLEQDLLLKEQQQQRILPKLVVGLVPMIC